jgi:hypothetical protein
MKTARLMQDVITAIAQKHGLNLNASEAHLKLERDGFMPLVIEKIGPHLVSVAHYFQMNGDAIADPDVVFFTGYGHWLPIEISQVLGYERVAWLSEDGKAIKSIKIAAQADLASFCLLWAKGIKGQHWLEQGSLPQKGGDLG